LTQVFDTPIISNDTSIDRVLNAGLPVALVFVNGPITTALDETLKRLARQHAGELLVVRIPANENPATTRRFNVRHTPALATVRGGQTLSQADSIQASDLEQHVAYLLGKGPRPQPAPRPESQSAAQTPRRYNAGPEPAGRSAPSDRPLDVTDASFDQDVMRSPVPVIVDFWAPWCGPCRMVAPVLEKLASELSGQVRIAKVNVDENPYVSQRYGIQSIPTMMIVKNGQIVDRWMGAYPEPAMRSRISAALQR
jgi:thioredoxin 1